MTRVSGVYFGHMKACTLSPILADFEATMSHIPFCTGYTPNEQKNTINTMIEKKGEKKIQ